MAEIMQAVCANFGAQLREFNGEQITSTCW